MSFWVKSWWFRPFFRGKKMGFVLKMGERKQRVFAFRSSITEKRKQNNE